MLVIAGDEDEIQREADVNFSGWQFTTNPFLNNLLHSAEFNLIILFANPTVYQILSNHIIISWLKGD